MEEVARKQKTIHWISDEVLELVEKRINVAKQYTGNNSTGSLEKLERRWKETKPIGYHDPSAHGNQSDTMTHAL